MDTPRATIKSEARPIAHHRCPRGARVCESASGASSSSRRASPMSRSRRPGSFCRHRAAACGRRGVVGRQRGPVRLALEDARERVGHRVALERAVGPSASRTARSRTPRCPCACRPPARAPAPGSCRPACRGSARPPCRRASRTAAASGHRSRSDAPSVLARPKSSTFARTSLDGTPARSQRSAARCWPASDRDGRSLSRAPRRAPRRSGARWRALRRSAAARARGDRRASAPRRARGPARVTPSASSRP